jgi:hypothetical protein
LGNLLSQLCQLLPHLAVVVIQLPLPLIQYLSPILRFCFRRTGLGNFVLQLAQLGLVVYNAAEKQGAGGEKSGHSIHQR